MVLPSRWEISCETSCRWKSTVCMYHRGGFSPLRKKTKQKQLQPMSCLGKKSPKPKTAFPFHKQFSAKRKRSFIFCEPTKMSYSPVRKSHLYYGIKDVFLIQANRRALHETAFGGKGKGVLLWYKENSLSCLGRRNCSKKQIWKCFLDSLSLVHCWTRLK